MDKRIKEEFTKDFETTSKKVDLSFDVNKLEPNTENVKNKTRLKWIPLSIGLVCAATAAVVLPIALTNANSFKSNSELPKKDTIEFTKQQYNQNAIKVAESNTFKKLNYVPYPFNQSTVDPISAIEKESYDNFTNKTYHSLVKTSKKDNMTYCSVGLYSIMNELEGATSREDLTNRFNSLLGLNRQDRIKFYFKLLEANNYGGENNTTQLMNSAFFHNRFDYNQDYVNLLTKLYCQAFQLDVHKDADVDKMVKWVNDAVNDDKFIDKQFLEIDEDTQLLLFSTLYFKNAWRNKYLETNNLQDDFYLADGSVVTATYMRHSYLIDSYYDYEKYVSFKDTYDSGASVTYLVPKDANDSIYELTKDDNIFVDNKDNIVSAENEEEYSPITVNLQTPKFKSELEVNFKDCLKDLGFEDMYDKNLSSFRNAFDPNNAPDVSWIETIKQKNEIEFNESGAIIKSVTMANMGGATAIGPHEMDTLNVKLNQPFIYIIRDKNETPIFVGHVDNPTQAS